MLWACFKEFFTIGGQKKVNQNTVFAIFELSVALLISQQFTFATFLLLSGLVLAFNLRQKYEGAVGTFMAFFLVYYLTLNFSVNMFDLCWNHLFKGISYSHDEDFVSSFSYKSHSLVLVSMLAFISAQYTRPAFVLFKEVPNSLALLHTFSILVSFSLVVNFLFELTSMAP